MTIRQAIEDNGISEYANVVIRKNDKDIFKGSVRQLYDTEGILSLEWDECIVKGNGDFSFTIK